jgi:hypothetical protein
MLFKSGDRVRITFDGKTAEGEIFLACSSGLSITVSFNGRLGNYTGLMPLMWVEDHFVDLVQGQAVTITRMGRILPWPRSSAKVSQGG